MIDTHTHLYLPEFADDNQGQDAVRRALAAGVSHMIFPNVDLGTIQPMESLAAKFPSQISCAMGLHPTEVNGDWQQTLQQVVKLLTPSAPYVAVGEVGIDLYWDATFCEQQMQVLDIQAGIAKKLNLPLIIHCREGLAQTLEVLSAHRGIRAVFHSFGGDATDIEAIRRLGDFYFGINGIVTFKNSSLRNILPIIGLDRILLETDSPYLAPVPRRGKRNESSFLPYIAAFIADSLGTDVATVDATTTANAHQLFTKLP